MNILFLSLGEFDSFQAVSVHVDLMKKFSEEHNVFLACKNERRNNENTKLEQVGCINVLRVRTGNLKNVGLIEKGISTIRLERQFICAIKKFFSDISFDLVLYTTPPITFARVVQYIKQRDGAISYLMLKDIFPQNAVDIGMLSIQGVRKLPYMFFRHKERQLYKVSDYIGCMSPANVKYILKNNPSIDPCKVEICPNCINVVDHSVTDQQRIEIRKKYNIPLDKIVFVYGGNLGKPQGIDFLIKCLDSQAQMSDVYFLIIGSGTEYSKLECHINNSKQTNVRLMNKIPRADYDKLVGGCDVGLIFLDHRFTIPNFPSRILSYMQAKLPVYAVTDENTDIGQIAVENAFGWWTVSNDLDAFCQTIELIKTGDRKNMGCTAYDFLLDNYSVDNGYRQIIKHML